MADGNSLINLGDLGKPATKLIEKISDAIGGIARPTQIVRVAKAQAEADEIKALSQIRINDLQTRALQRFIGEETIKQKNIEDITLKALPDLKPDARPQDMKNGWILNFFDKGKLISEEEMQVLWGKVLAGEANSPGSFSKRTVNILAELDGDDANLFQSFCSFMWEIDGLITPVVPEQEDFFLEHWPVSFGTVKRLSEIGLIYHDSEGNLYRSDLPSRTIASYFNIAIEVIFEPEKDRELLVGAALFTDEGQELARICGAKPIPELFEYIVHYWKENSGAMIDYPLKDNRTDTEAVDP